MDSNNRIAQVYGYAVCLITIIVILISITGLVNSLFNYTDPIHSDRSTFGGNYVGGQYPVTSFNAYKRAYEERRPKQMTGGPMMGADRSAPVVSPALSDSALRVMYQDDRNDQIENVRSHALRGIVTSILMIVIAGALFMVHWRWLRPKTSV